MPGCKKVFYGVLGGCLAAVLGISIVLAQVPDGAQPPLDEPAKQHAAQESASPKQADTPKSTVSDLDRKTVTEEIQGENEQTESYYREENLRAQWAIANATGKIVTWTIVQIILGVTGAGLLIWTLIETRHATNLASETSQRQLRAYVSVGTKGICVTDNKPKIQITNYGQTPAWSVDIWCKIVDSPVEDPSEERGRFLYQDIAIFPGQDLHQFWAESMADRENRFLYMYMDYTDAFNRRWRTKFACEHRGGDLYQYRHDYAGEQEITPPPKGWSRRFWTWLKSFPI